MNLINSDEERDEISAMLNNTKYISIFLSKLTIELRQITTNYNIKKSLYLQEKTNRSSQEILSKNIQRIQNKYYLERRTFM